MLRAAGLAYPVLVVLVIVATGNHFFVDAPAGLAVALASAMIGALLPAASDNRIVVDAPVTVIRQDALRDKAA